MRKFALYICLAFTVMIMLPLKGIAQDIHFSQTAFSPLNVNPANTGFFKTAFRFSTIYRNQWGTVTVPFQTMSASFDTQLKKRQRLRDMFGIGFIINSDKAGDSEYGTTQGMLSLSYIKGLNYSSTQYVSFGLQAGFAQRSINYSGLYFDNQFDGFMYRFDYPSDEILARDNFFFYDMGVGAHWYYEINSGKIFNAGMSLFHLNKPRQSLMGDDDVVLPRKLTFYGEGYFRISSNAYLLPGIMLSFQQPYSEVYYGAKVKVETGYHDINNTAFLVGLYNRHSDALALMVGYDFQNFNVGFSYDINYSDLAPASQTVGGFEVALIYQAQRKTKRHVLKEIPCPIF